MKGKKIKNYASLALALALVLPATSYAAATNDDGEARQITDQEIMKAVRGENQQISSEVKMNLDETGKVANYTINITQAKEEDLQAIFYINDGSNLENLQVIPSQSISDDDIKTEDSPLGKKITVKLNGANAISLKADIKEAKTSNLLFDYIIAGQKENAITSQRVISSIKGQDDGKKVLDQQNVDGLASTIDGKFAGEETIEWLDFLVNSSDQVLTTDYDINLSENQTNPSKITLEIFKASKDGFISESKHDLDFGHIKNLTIPANGLAKISFKTQVDPSEQVFTANGVKIEKNQELANNSANEVKALTNEINENDANIRTEMQRLDKELAEDNPSNNPEETEENEVSKLTKEIDEKNQEILDQMRAIDKYVPVKENQEPVNHQVEIVTLNDSKIEDTNNKQTTSSQITAQTVQSLITELDDRTLQIQELMREIDKENLVWYQQNQGKGQNERYDSQTIADLIKDLDDRNKAIQDELENIYGKYAVDSVMDLSKSIDKETYELITGVDKNNETIQEIIDQVNLSIETSKVLDDEKELANIKALLDNVEELSVNNEQALDKVEGEDRKEENSQNFKKVVPGYSEKVYKDLEKVVTVTLDPLKAPQGQVDKETATKSYPTIAKYLEELAVVKDLLK